MKFSPYVIDLLKRKSKKDFRLSGDCEYLALDIIARYLDFENWDLLKCFDDKSNSSFSAAEDEIRVSDLATGQHIQISYLPDRLILNRIMTLSP